MIDLRINEVELQYELKHENVRNEVLEEMRSDREQKMKTKMQDVDKAMVLTFNETFEL